MLLWWSSWSVRRPPAGLVAAAEGMVPALELEAAASAGAAPEQDAESAGEAQMVVPVVADEEGVVDEGLRQAEALVAATWAELQSAIKGGRTAPAARLRKEWKEAVQTLRQWQKDIGAIRAARMETLRVRELNQELTAILGIISASFNVALQDGIAGAAPELPPDEVRRRALSLRDACFRHLRETRFAEAWSPSASTALNGG